MSPEMLRITRLETDVKDLEEAAEYWHKKVKDTDNIKQELMGLWLILDTDGEDFISREYVKEKLLRICQGTMSFHPVIKEKLTKENYDRWLR